MRQHVSLSSRVSRKHSTTIEFTVEVDEIAEAKFAEAKIPAHVMCAQIIVHQVAEFSV